jgi:hypothetical protein
LDYLGHYTYKVAIGNHRITKVSKEEVIFRYKIRNFKGGRYACKTKFCHLSAAEFIRRFLFHELPTGFTRIRHYGFLGNNAKTDRLRKIRESLGTPEEQSRPTGREKDTRQYLLELTGIDITSCPTCKAGKLRKIEEFDGVYKRNGYWGRLSPPIAI